MFTPSTRRITTSLVSGHFRRFSSFSRMGMNQNNTNDKSKYATWNQRPWLEQKEKDNQKEQPQYDSQCYLCPGSKRTHGDVNPKYTPTFVLWMVLLLFKMVSRHPQTTTNKMICYVPKEYEANVTLFVFHHDTIWLWQKLQQMILFK